jgi:hypothetical protein
MSLFLDNTPNNLNKSIFYYDPKKLFDANYGKKVQRDQIFINRIIEDDHVNKIHNMCFDKCVNDFNIDGFSETELQCFKGCKSSSMKAYSSLEITADIINKKVSSLN